MLKSPINYFYAKCQQQPNEDAYMRMHTFRITFTKQRLQLQQLLTFILTSMNVFFLSRSRVLKPNLRHTLTETGHRGDALQILSIRITVDLKVGLQHLQLLFGEGGAYTFRFTFMITITITAV